RTERLTMQESFANDRNARRRPGVSHPWGRRGRSHAAALPGRIARCNSRRETSRALSSSFHISRTIAHCSAAARTSTFAAMRHEPFARAVYLRGLARCAIVSTDALGGEKG